MKWSILLLRKQILKERLQVCTGRNRLGDRFLHSVIWLRRATCEGVGRGRWTVISLNKDLRGSPRKLWEQSQGGTQSHQPLMVSTRGIGAAVLKGWGVVIWMLLHRIHFEGLNDLSKVTQLLLFGGMFESGSIWFQICVLYLNILQVTILWYYELY